MDIIAVHQNDCLDDVSTKTLLKAHLYMGCLDEAEKLSQEICTIGIRANRVKFSEFLHARAFASAGAGGRPWSMIPSAASGLLDRGRAGDSSLIPLPPPKRMTDFTTSWDHVNRSPPDEWCREWSFRKREVRDSEFPPWGLHSWFLRGAQLCVVTDRESAELRRPQTTRPVGPLIDSNKSLRYTPAPRTPEALTFFFMNVAVARTFE